MKNRYRPKIDKSTLALYCDIMVAGNTILKQLYEKIGSDYSNRSAFRAAILHKVDQGEKTIRFGRILVKKESLDKILAVRSIEVDLLESFSGTIYKMAMKWHREGSGQDLEDLQQEASQALLKAVCYYCDKDIKFITFATDAIKKRMITVTNHGSVIRLPDNADNRKLLKRYNQAVVDLEDRANFDTACDAIGASTDERNNLKQMLLALKVSHGSACGSNDEDSKTMDFTAGSRPVLVTPSGKRAYFRHSGSDGQDVFQKDMESILIVRKVLAHADQLPEFDRAVLFASLEGEYGWQAKVASENINKSTGKPFSRMAVRFALERLGKRIESMRHQNVASKVA